MRNGYEKGRSGRVVNSNGKLLKNSSIISPASVKMDRETDCGQESK